MTQVNAPLAQLVEHLTLNQGVQGSSPWRRTLKNWFLGHRSPGVGSFFAIKRYGGVPESKYFFTGQRNRAILNLAKTNKLERHIVTQKPRGLSGVFCYLAGRAICLCPTICLCSCRLHLPQQR